MLSIEPLQDACKVWGKCYHSQKRNEKPHEMQVCFTTKDTDIGIRQSSCDCPIGLSGKCGHVAGFMYQIANYKTMGLKALPEDIAKTSQPQTWHKPRGTKITGKAVQDLEVSGYSKEGPCEAMPRNIKSTLYNPARGQPIDWCVHARKLSAVTPDLLVLPALCETACSVPCSFGPVPKGCILSYQQKPSEDCILNIYDGIGFPELPASNVMRNTYSTVLSSQQSVKLEGLKLTLHEVKKFEEQTRLQSQTPLWYKIRKNRITASKIGEIFKRRKDESSLVQRLQSTRHVMTTAMKQGLASEPVAATCYAEVHQNKVNLYPCGVVVNPWAPWLAASPDRKVYFPERFPAFGLLEIKCPQVSSILETTYLAKDETGSLKLKRNHNYYFQVLAQLAVTGLDWCDFFVWCQSDHHLETIYLNRDLWDDVKMKIDQFFFNHFL